MSKELVPLDYQRYAYNAHHGTDLQHHNSLLNAEQAAQINDNYDIELYFGTHGLVPESGARNAYDAQWLPTQKEYGEVANVVNSLHPGDTLFMEGYGFREPTREPLPGMPKPGEPTLGADPFSTSWLVSSSLEMSVLKIRQGARDQLEEDRRNYKLSAWEYARQLATLKGIRVVHADHDAFDKHHATVLNEGESAGDLLEDLEPKNEKLQKSTHASRELRAPNVVKDWALDHLPEAEARNAQGRRPRLAVVFGGGHQEPIEQAFVNLGLHARTTVMKESSFEERRQEQARRQAAQFMDLLGTVAKIAATSQQAEDARAALTASSLFRNRSLGQFASLGRIDTRKLGAPDPERFKISPPEFKL